MKFEIINFNTTAYFETDYSRNMTARNLIRFYKNEFNCDDIKLYTKDGHEIFKNDYLCKYFTNNGYIQEIKLKFIL